LLTKRRTIEPQDIEFKKDEHERLFLEYEEQTEGPVRVKQPFPLSHPDSFLVVENMEGEFIGLIKKFKDLDRDSRQLVEESLEYSYFLPKVVAIEEIKEHFGLQFWRVQTDRGPRSFEVKSRKRDIRWLTDRHIIVQDADGNKYEIPDLDELDPESVGKLEMEV